MIRSARSEEVEQVRAIERASAQRFVAIDMQALADDEPTDAATLQRRIAAGGLLVHADEHDRPIAFVMFRPLAGSLYIEQIDVLPEHAGRRIGAALLDAVAARTDDALLLSTFRDVAWNAPYYRRLGFVDLPDAALDEHLRAIRREHVARGLDETRRVFMRRPVR